MLTDRELTVELRKALIEPLPMNASCHGITSYCWHQGEAWYLGNPIAGHTTANEQRAIDKVRLIIKSI
jgi:hypothetical protein